MQDCQQWGRVERKDEDAAERGKRAVMPTLLNEAKRMMEVFVYILRARMVSTVVAFVLDAFAVLLSVTKNDSEGLSKDGGRTECRRKGSATRNGTGTSMAAV